MKINIIKQQLLLFILITPFISTACGQKVNSAGFIPEEELVKILQMKGVKIN